MRRPIEELRATSASIEKSTSTLRSAVTRATPALVGESIAAKVTRAMESEPFRYSPQSYRDSTTRLWLDALTNERHLAAGVPLLFLEKTLPPFAQDVIDTEAALRADVGLTWRDGFDKLDNGGMLQAAIYRELRRSFINEASPSVLRPIYERAIEERHLATSRIDAELIEDRVSRRGGLASSEADLPDAKRLRERIQGLQELRIDPELTAMHDTIEAAKKAISRAKLISIAPVDLSTQLPSVQEVVARELAEASA